MAQNIWFPHRFSVLVPEVTLKGVQDSPDVCAPYALGMSGPSGTPFRVTSGTRTENLYGNHIF